ncbi:MAG: hypothetical protein LBN07_05185 [Christensenellaceae bacterium]|jgi:hypothetical protein|nr:hypothetical protein [Christensenellaceae bacterium]
MAKIFVENTEIKISEKVDIEDGAHQIKGDYYTMHSVITKDFKSTIFSYGDVSVLVSKITRYGEEYYKIVIFNDAVSKAWQLIVLSAKLDIKIKRLTGAVFLVVAESNVPDVVSQISFCKLKPSTKVDEVTINFSKLNEVNYIGDNSILLCYDEADVISGRTTHVLSMYNYEGKLLKNFYEYNDDDPEQYGYIIENKTLKIVKK